VSEEVKEERVPVEAVISSIKPDGLLTLTFSEKMVDVLSFLNLTNLNDLRSEVFEIDYQCNVKLDQNPSNSPNLTFWNVTEIRSTYL